MADAPVRRDELAVLGLAGGLLVLWGPSLNAGLLTPRIALTLVAAGPGLVSVVGLGWRRDLAARLLLAFLGWTFLSAVLCGQPRIALLGTYGSDLGWIHILAWCSIWGLGRRLGPGGRSYLPLVLIGGVAINALVALAQMGFDTQVGLLRVLDGRASGLAPSSLFLGGLVRGDLGESIVSRRPVVEDIAEYAPATFELATAASGHGEHRARCTRAGSARDAPGSKRAAASVCSVLIMVPPFHPALPTVRE